LSPAPWGPASYAVDEFPHEVANVVRAPGRGGLPLRDQAQEHPVHACSLAVILRGGNRQRGAGLGLGPFPVPREAECIG
jgi:hypothetical protein